MKRVGLALSGGGFRATLYHLGVVRFLRDAGILPKISHLTTVSGGSILGAHLALNWDKYCGSAEEFQQAADEIIRFVQLDVRNRIVRRFPLTSSLNTLRRLLRMRPARQLTRPGLLERHYEEFLYGDTPLSELPDRPRLDILSTNLSEGCLCAFNRSGLLVQSRSRGRRDTFKRVHVGFATVPMAVACSSAFPGFFPPLELRGWDVGVDEGEFHRQAYTDGGVFDNLGLRMFRCIEQSWETEAAPLRKEDFLELEDTTSALLSAESLPEHSPLRRIREMLAEQDSELLGLGQTTWKEGSTAAMIRGLWDIIRSEDLYLDPIFQNMELADASAQTLLTYVIESGRRPEISDALWLNRQIIESALRQVIGKPCLLMGRKGFDQILVSDAGGKFKVARDSGAGGLVGTALRSTDILMDRVWQLELEAFENTPGIIFFPIAETVERSQDPLAPDPEIQRQAARIRTDLDYFSDLEVSALVQHGYCVARKMCRAHSDIISVTLPSDAPWKPLANRAGENGDSANPPDLLQEPGASLAVARRLQVSSRRKVWSTLFNLRDWPTYVWLPLIACVMLLLPYTLYKTNKQAAQQEMVLTALANTSPLYQKILELLESGPLHAFPPQPFNEVASLEPRDISGFEVISDSRIFDLRGWGDNSTETVSAYSYALLRVRRNQDGSDNTHLRFQRKSDDESLSIFCRQQSLNPIISRMPLRDGGYLWEIDLDLVHIPLGNVTEVVVEGVPVSESISEDADEGRFNFAIGAETGLVQVWVLMPAGRTYDFFEISGHPFGKPELTQSIVPSVQVDLPLGAIATFQLINPEGNYRYECRWKWKREQ